MRQKLSQGYKSNHQIMILLSSALLVNPQPLLIPNHTNIYLNSRRDSLSLYAISKTLFFTAFQKRKRKKKSNKVRGRAIRVISLCFPEN